MAARCSVVSAKNVPKNLIESATAAFVNLARRLAERISVAWPARVVLTTVDRVHRI
jgi:hypothetical protein